MKPLSQLTPPASRYQVSKKGVPTSERAGAVSQILAIINSEREGTKYKPLTGRGLAIKLSHLSLSDLYFLLSKSKDCKNRGYSFSKWMWGSLKVK